MALLARALQPVEARGLERSFISNPAEWLVTMFGGAPSATGRAVTPMAAIRNSGVWACVRVISEDLSSLPLILYRRLDKRAKERALEHPTYTILHDAPNPEMDAMQFVETMQAWAELWPCAYAEIVRNLSDGSLAGLWPLHPDLVTPMRVNGELAYRVQLPAGQTTEDGLNYRILARELIFKLRGLSLDGVNGLGAVRTQHEAIGLALALEEYGARFFGNGASPGGVIEHPGELGTDTHKRLKASWEARHQGLANAHRVAILEEGMKWHATGLQNDHAQFIESRRFQLEETARIWRVPPHLIQDLSRSTNNNIEHQSIEYVMHTIRPRAVRWERAIAHQVLTPAERVEFFAEFLIDALLRGDALSRANTLAIKRRNGVINADEWRELDNENPLPDGQGQAYLVESNNMSPVDLLVERVKVEAAAQLVNAGFDPAESLELVGLRPIKHPGGQSPAVPPPPPGPPPEAAAERALQPVLEAEFGRLLRRHSKAVAAAVRKHDLRGTLQVAPLQEWARAYLAEEEAALRIWLEPVERALLRVRGDDEAAAGAAAATQAKRYCRALWQQLGEAVRTGEIGAVLAVAQAWEDPGAAIRLARERVSG